MPVIPNERSVGRVAPSGKTSVVKYRPAASGFHDAANAMASVGGALKAKTDSDVSKAKADFLVLQTQFDSETDNDEDYSTLTNRYTEKVNTGLGGLSESISDPRAREDFVNWARPQVARGIASTEKKAFSAQTDYERGGLNERLEKLREASIVGDVTIDDVTGERNDPMINGRNAANDMIDSMVVQNFMGAADASVLKNKFKTDTAIGKLKMMEPENRVKALKEPWAKNLPSDTRASMLRAAEEQLIDDKAQHIVDGMNDRDLDLGQADKEARKIKDASLRAEVERRYSILRQRAKVDELEGQKDFVDEQWDAVKSGETTVRRLKEDHVDQWENLTAQQQSSMYAAEASRANGRANPYNSDAEYALNALNRQRDFVGLHRAFLNTRASLSPEQDKRWSSISVDGVVPEEYSGMMNASQIVTNRLEKDSITSEKTKAETLLAVDDFVRTETIANKGIPPTSDKINKFLDDKMMEYDPPGWFNKSTLGHMSDSDKSLLINEYSVENPVIFKRVNKLISLINPTAGKSEMITALKDVKAGDARWAITMIKRKDRALFKQVVATVREKSGGSYSASDIIDQFIIEMEQK